ncbi:unknown [Euproctis pseudoconspersa nucleopolyhedrovirus]|uniref:Uncharacterized protein n=1 Tax=Euproctis pseudoconspersa nucleopolyhedrovirus TaxID=307467 RepID=C3TWT4_9ABAC|nr:hypothetical protein EupsNPV_gp026 [Euproctis pseudoconspersa nucleopolyhedrovirus]ACO53476.1 unknown [Euproctis pseudoconspersa nucleopolyhedrovirus]
MSSTKCATFAAVEATALSQIDNIDANPRSSYQRTDKDDDDDVINNQLARAFQKHVVVFNRRKQNKRCIQRLLPGVNRVRRRLSFSCV